MNFRVLHSAFPQLEDVSEKMNSEKVPTEKKLEGQVKKITDMLFLLI